MGRWVLFSLNKIVLGDALKWLVKNISKKADKAILLNGADAVGAEKVSAVQMNNSKACAQSTKVVYPDTSRMVIYDPRQAQGSQLPAVSNSSTSTVALAGNGNSKVVDEILKVVSPALVAFITRLPAVEGPSPDVDVVLSILLQSTVPIGQTGKLASSQQIPAGAGPSTSDLSGSSKTRLNPSVSSHRLPKDGQPGKRKDRQRQEDDETTTVHSRPQPRDLFRIRQMQRSRGVSSSQTGSAASGGSAISGERSAFSGEQSVSTE